MNNSDSITAKPQETNSQRSIPPNLEPLWTIGCQDLLGLITRISIAVWLRREDIGTRSLTTTVATSARWHLWVSGLRCLLVRTLHWITVPSTARTWTWGRSVQIRDPSLGRTLRSHGIMTTILREERRGRVVRSRGTSRTKR
jgi:hypothetical protein